MTANHGRWIVRNYRLHHGVYWLLVIATLVQPRASPVAAQVASLPPSPGVYPFDSKIKVTPKMTIILLCLMCTFFLLVCASVYLRQCVAQCVARRTSRSLTGGFTSERRWLALGLDAEVIDSFPTFVYSEVKGLKIGKGTLECAVCLNEFEDDETLRLLPHCSHVFHADCIDTWLSSHVTCPVCRADLFPKPGEPLAFTVLSHDTETELTHQQDQYPDRADDDFVVNISDTIQNQTGPRGPISDGDIERFTLRLPEEVRSQFVRSSLSRTRSCVAFPRARSWRKGYRSRSGGTGRGRNFFYYERYGEGRRSDRWEFMTTPPFISRDGPVR